MTAARLLLDTHVWLWLAFGTRGQIRTSTRNALEQAWRLPP